MKKLLFICMGIFLCCTANAQSFDESMDEVSNIVPAQNQLSQELINGTLRDSVLIVNGEALFGDPGQEQYWITIGHKQELPIVDGHDRLAKVWQFCRKHPDRKKEYIIVISQAFRNGLPDSGWRLVVAESLKN